MFTVTTIECKKYKKIYGRQRRRRQGVQRPDDILSEFTLRYIRYCVAYSRARRAYSKRRVYQEVFPKQFLSGPGPAYKKGAE